MRLMSIVRSFIQELVLPLNRLVLLILIKLLVKFSLEVLHMVARLPTGRRELQESQSATSRTKLIIKDLARILPVCKPRLVWEVVVLGLAQLSKKYIIRTATKIPPPIQVSEEACQWAQDQLVAILCNLWDLDLRR